MNARFIQIDMMKNILNAECCSNERIGDGIFVVYRFDISILLMHSCRTIKFHPLKLEFWNGFFFPFSNTRSEIHFTNCVLHFENDAYKCSLFHSVIFVNEWLNDVLFSIPLVCTSTDKTAALQRIHKDYFPFSWVHQHCCMFVTWLGMFVSIQKWLLHWLHMRYEWSFVNVVIGDWTNKTILV